MPGKVPTEGGSRVRKGICVPMIILCLLLSGCGGTEGGGSSAADTLRQSYRQMEECSMTAEVACGGTEEQTAFTLQCRYVPGGKSTVEVLAPDTAAGIRATLEGERLELVYDGLVLPAGSLSSEDIAPASCLPRLMDALREGWLLEENEETLDGEKCVRLCLDQTGEKGGKIVSVLWLRQADGTPVLGEISVEDTVILQARFTDFQFGAIIPSE